MNRDNGKCVLSTANTADYCDNGKTYQKSGCRPAEQYAKLCSDPATRSDECPVSAELFICNVNLVRNDCNPTFQGNSVDSVFGTISPPPQVSSIGFGSAGINKFLSNILNLIYVIAGIAFVFMIVLSAFQWIISGGDKEAIAKARGRLTNAIIGIFLLALSFVIIRLIGQITGFSFFTGGK